MSQALPGAPGGDEMIALAGYWSYAFSALLFALLAAWQVSRPAGGMQRRTLAVAFGLTALWAAVSLVSVPRVPVAGVAEALRNLAWLGFMLALVERGRGEARRPSIIALYAVIGCVIVAQMGLDLLLWRWRASPGVIEALFFILMLLRITVTIGALVLVHNLYTAAAPEARWGIRLPMIALGVMWAYDLNLYTVAYLTHAWPAELYIVRGFVMLLLVPLFALASRRNTRWRMRISRTVTFQSLSLMAIGCYLVAMVILARLFDFAGGSFAPFAQIMVVIAMSAGALLLLTSRRVRAWLKVKIVKHFFQHRYDYRVEWMRFTETLGRPGEDAAPLEQRVIQAVADITESPGGLLLLPDEQGGLCATARWNWARHDAPAKAGDARLVSHFGTGRIVEFDALRRADPASDPEAALIPEWIMTATAVWAAVPLLHNDRLVGAVLLARPEIGRQLDWEDFDLLRIVGRQVASYLAEAQSQEALSEARRFDEFNRRFAFIMHDIKNLVSQLSLVARNAERHADNPEFRVDMVATLRSSVGKMNDLLARLSQHNKGRVEEPRPVALGPLLNGVAAAKRPLHTVHVEQDDEIVAAADPGRLDQALTHLVQNAIDASPRDAPVRLRLGRRDGEAVIDVIDRGTGMSAEFVRAKLFRPFTSTKEGGFGVGAFEARALIVAMGGRLEIESREAEGSRFTVILPLVEGMAQPLRQAEGTDA